MSLDLLTKMIEAACADGNVTKEELMRLQQKAKELGVKEEDLDFLIKGELDRIFSKTTNQKNSTSEQNSFQIENISSGFITNNSPENLQSGFLTNNQQSGNKPQSISNFEFTDEILLSKQGAMSVVYKVKYLGKWVILKRLKPEHQNNPTYNDLFYKEFENAFHLDHPNIVRLISKGTDEKGSFYFMEYIDGRTLTEAIGIQGIIDNTLIRKIAIQILDALKYVHLKQVIHRDLKPDNILLTYKGDNVKILDFGLAAADYFDDYLQKAGTPKYAAPEQLEPNGYIDQRTDIYSFGLILLEMLTGQIENKDISKITDQQLAGIIHKAVQPVPKNRFNNCDEILQILKIPTLQKQVPKWLEDKIKEFATDGQISQRELTVLQMEAQNANVDYRMVQALIDVEVENAQKRISENKQKENDKEEKRQEEQETKRKQLELQRKEEELRREHERLQQMKEQSYRKQGKSTENKRTTKIVTPLIILGVVIVLAIILFRPGGCGRNIFKKTTETKDSITSEIYFINAKSLNLRSEPDKNNTANILYNFVNGKEVEVYDSIPGWKKVRVNGMEGYMSSEFLTPKKAKRNTNLNENNNKKKLIDEEKKKTEKITEEETPPLNESTNEIIEPSENNIQYVVVKTAPLRPRKSLLAKKILDLEYGALVQVLSTEGIWVRVKVKDQVGYMQKSQVIDKLPQR